MLNNTYKIEVKFENLETLIIKDNKFQDVGLFLLENNYITRLKANQKIIKVTRNIQKCLYEMSLRWDLVIK